MAQRKTRLMTIAMRGTRFRADPDGFPELRCLKCGSTLELIQPGQDLPDRLLGVCPQSCDNCGGWHIINGAYGGGKAMIALVPDSAEFQAAYERAQ
jgi:hypothetical protein